MKIFRLDTDEAYNFCNGLIREQSRSLLYTDVQALDEDFVYELMWSDGIKASPPVPTDLLTPIHYSMHLSRRAVDALEPLLRPNGYFRRIKLSVDIEYRLFVCTTEIDPLDHPNLECTRRETGKLWDIQRFAFLPDLIRDRHIFRLPLFRATLFVSDAFVHAVEANGLSGFDFQEIWSSETGGVLLPDGIRGRLGFPSKEEQAAKRRARIAARKALRDRLIARGAVHHFNEPSEETLVRTGQRIVKPADF